MRADPRVEQSRALIMEAAQELFLEGGAAAVTVDAVASRSGVARTTVYRQWKNRDELLVDVFAGFRFNLTPPPPDLETAERLRLVMRQLAACVRQPLWRRAIPVMLDAAARQGELGSVFARLHHADDMVLLPVLAEATTDGTLPPDTDLKEAFLQLTSAMILAALMEPESVDDRFADRQVELFLASRRPVAPRRARGGARP